MTSANWITFWEWITHTLARLRSNRIQMLRSERIERSHHDFASHFETSFSSWNIRNFVKSNIFFSQNTAHILKGSVGRLKRVSDSTLSWHDILCNDPKDWVSVRQPCRYFCSHDDSVFFIGVNWTLLVTFVNLIRLLSRRPMTSFVTNINVTRGIWWEIRTFGSRIPGAGPLLDTNFGESTKLVCESDQYVKNLI